MMKGRFLVPWKLTLLLYLLLLASDRDIFTQGTALTDGTMLWVNGSQLLLYKHQTRDWLAGTLPNPHYHMVDFVDTRRTQESIAVHFAWHLQVMSERGTKTISVLKASTMRAVFAHVGTSPKVGHVTVDWLSNNVYWTDQGFGWIGLQGLKRDPAITVTNARIKVVVSSSLDSPYGVTVLPDIKRLFWTDHGTPAKLEGSDLLGNDRRVLVWQGLVKPTAISSDHVTRLLYWVDEDKGTVESCDINGQQRRIVISLQQSSISGLQVFGNAIILSARSQNELQAYDKETGRIAAAIISGVINPGDITVFSASLQPRDSVTCDSLSCDHICIHNESCVCTSGYSLSQDGTTCTELATALWKSFIVSTSSQICALPVNMLFSHPYLSASTMNFSTLCLSVSAVDIRHLAVDSHNASLYYVSGTTIRQYRIHSGSDTAVYHAPDAVLGLVYDWRSGALLWTHQGAINAIYRLYPGQDQPAVLYTRLNKPSHMAVNPYTGSLFWIEDQNRTSSWIVSGSVDGTKNRVIVLSSNLLRTRHLSYDYKTNRLYWLDVDHVGSIDATGTNLHKILLSSIYQYKGLAIFRGYLVWTTVTSSGTNVTFTDIDLSNSNDIVSFSLPSKVADPVTSLLLYDANSQVDIDHVICELDNGGCSQLCFIDGGTQRCRCHFGYQLQKDGVSCKPEYVSTDFFLATDSLAKKLYQIDSRKSGVFAAQLQDGARPNLAIFNPPKGEIIWHDSQAAAIKLSFLNGSHVQIIRSLQEPGGTKPNTVGAMSIDHSTSSLYFTEIKADNSEGWIRVISLKSLVLRTLKSSRTAPHYLAIAAEQGMLVYSTLSGTIYKSDMAMESELTQLYASGNKLLSGLVLSQNGTVVEWSYQEADEIWRMPLSTLIANKRIYGSGSHPYALHAWGSTLYYLAGAGRTVKSLSGSGTESVVMEYPEFGTLTSLHFFGERLSAVWTACSEKNGRCSTLCLPTTNGRRCQCADGVSLIDQRTCSNVERCGEDIPNGQLSAACDRYPEEICGFTCRDGYAANLDSRYIQCGASGQWKTSVDNLCLRMCQKGVEVTANGHAEESCDLTSGSLCSLRCDDGYVQNEQDPSARLLQCGQDGLWKMVSPGTACLVWEPNNETLPVYAIAAISAGAVALVAVAVGCYLFRRMKKHGRRDSNRPGGIGLGPAIPAVSITGMEGDMQAAGGYPVKRLGGDEEDEGVYDTLDELQVGNDSSERYHSFSRISPNVRRKPHSSDGVHGVNNRDFEEKKAEYTEPIPDYLVLDPADTPPTPTALNPTTTINTDNNSVSYRRLREERPPVLLTVPTPYSTLGRIDTSSSSRAIDTLPAADRFRHITPSHLLRPSPNKALAPSEHITPAFSPPAPHTKMLKRLPVNADPGAEFSRIENSNSSVSVAHSPKVDDDYLEPVFSPVSASGGGSYLFDLRRGSDPEWRA